MKKIEILGEMKCIIKEGNGEEIVKMGMDRFEMMTLSEVEI